MVTRQTAAPQHREALMRIYRSTREHELAMTPWDEPQKAAFIQMQFDAQDAHYRTHFSEASFEVLLVGDEIIGRLYVDRRPDEMRIVDIALLPNWRGRGVGAELLRELLHEAHARGVPVRIHVERQNPALRLYERLGFRVIEGGNEIYGLYEAAPVS